VGGAPRFILRVSVSLLNASFRPRMGSAGPMGTCHDTPHVSHNPPPPPPLRPERLSLAALVRDMIRTIRILHPPVAHGYEQDRAVRARCESLKQTNGLRWLTGYRVIETYGAGGPACPLVEGLGHAACVFHTGQQIAGIRWGTGARGGGAGAPSRWSSDQRSGRRWHGRPSAWPASRGATQLSAASLKVVRAFC
jgi:hypothetical protein